MQISVISFNIRCTSDPDGHSIAERAPRLAAVTEQYDADVIGFQEYVPEWGEHIAKYYGGRYDMFLKYRAESSLEGTPILWRKDKFDCLKTGYFWLSDTPEQESRGWDEVCNCYRMCVYTVLREKAGGKQFTFMNTHFGFGDHCHKGSAGLIYDYSRRISDHPTFVVGDFNMKPDSVGYAAMCGHFADVNACTANDLRLTYHGYHPDDPELQDAHIDFCFIDRSITPVSQTIIDQTVGGKFPSDHYGLHTVIEF